MMTKKQIEDWFRLEMEIFIGDDETLIISKQGEEIPMGLIAEMLVEGMVLIEIKEDVPFDDEDEEHWHYTKQYKFRKINVT